MPSDESKGSQLDAIGSLAQRQLDNTRPALGDTVAVRVLAQDGIASSTRLRSRSWTNSRYSLTDSFDMVVGFFMA